MNLDVKLLCCGFWLDVLGRGLLRFLLFICEREIGSAGSAPQKQKYPLLPFTGKRGSVVIDYCC